MLPSNFQPFHARRRPRLNKTLLYQLLRGGRPRFLVLILLLLPVSAVLCLLNLSNLFNLPKWSRLFKQNRNCDIAHLAKQYATYQTNESQYQAFVPVDIDNTLSSLYRRPDVSDTFADYKYRGAPSCNISSLDLHRPFAPLCPDRRSFLEAYSSGGRVGFDAPFMPRTCDLRWYSTQEICEIFSRFEKVIVVGDSMMRHVVGALNVLLRQNLGYGAVTSWNFNDEENKMCFCIRQFDVKACSIQGIYRTSDVLRHDPDSFACPKVKDTYTGETTSSVNLIVEAMLKFPLDPVEIQRFQDLLPATRPRKPVAFIFGHGLWNDLDLQATVNWLDGILAAIYEKAPYLQPQRLPRDVTPHDQPLSHMLFMTPNAAGIRKPDQWVTSQGDKALQMFEHSVRDLIFEPGERWYGRGIEHVGTWNMSIQMEKWDGVHLDLRGNLVKAMGVVNWLAFIEVEQW